MIRLTVSASSACISGVLQSLSRAFTSAPLSMSSLAISAYSARISIVSQFLSRASALAQFFKRSFTLSTITLTTLSS
jgi:hypothetical protein